LPSLVDSYKENLSAFISEWQGGAPVPASQPPQDDGSSQQIEDETSAEAAKKQMGPNHEELLEMLHYAWQSAALNHGFKVPPPDQLELAMKMAPKETISRLFGWTSDVNVIEKIRATYDSALKNISQQYLQKYGLKPDFVLFPYQTTSATAETKGSSTESKIPDVFQAAFGAWTEVAKKNEYKLPDEDEVLFAMSVGPDEAVISGFEWAEPGDFELVTKIVEGYKEELKSYRSEWERQGIVTGSQKPEAAKDEVPLFSVVPGVEKWISSLLDVEMQCAVVSYLNREQLDTLLEVAGLSHLFGSDKRISSGNNYGRDLDQLLGAALRLERRPDHCAVFDSSPYASAAAHDVEMRSVSIVGAFPRYELMTADSTAASFEELTAMNVRRLFGERVYDQPLEDSEQADPQIRRQTKTKYRWGDE
jgi:beta-phosphoglucomutase-like phosphatase (HAD superfamily)